MRRVVAIDLGGTKISASVIDSEGRIAARVKAATAGTVRQAAEIARQAADAAGAGWESIEGVGVIIPGIFFPATGKVWAPNIWGQEEVPMRDELQAALPVKVSIDSDRAGYVLGEQWLGVARGLADVVFVAVGTGIGAGILSGGRLVRGAGDIAGSIGWFALRREQTERGRQVGSLEAEAAGPAVARRFGAGSAEEVAAAARAGDKAALAVMEETARWLGIGVANLISAFNPAMVVMGGGLMQAADLLLEPLAAEARRWSQPVAARQARIALSALGEDAGLIGAARLALEPES